MSRPTIRDVARRAGVSTTTVSDALNGSGRLPQETRDHVMAIAHELGYRPRASARALRSGRSGQIGLFAPGLDAAADGLVGTGYYINLAMGAAKGALADELALVLLPAAPSIDRLLAFDVDGLIVCDPPRDHPAVAAFAGSGIPIVTCERDPTPGARHAGCVRNDHGAALRALLDHLADQGAERIALIAPGAELAWGAELGAAYAAWAAERGMAPMRADVPSTPLPEYAVQAAVALLDRGAPDAIVCAQDEGASAVVGALAERGLRVPEDVLVASCVDGLLMATAAPPLTAIDLKPAQTGRRAAELLSSILRGDVSEPVEIELPTELLVRASSVRRPA